MTQRSQQHYEPTAEDYAFSRLIAYAALQWPGYRDARHHRLIARKLEAVERGDCPRLIICMPPRHGKSMLASEFFAAWYLGRNPSHYVIAATYAQDLADDFGRKVRNQISDPSFGEIFPGVRLRSDSSSVKRFHVEGPENVLELEQDGAYFATGIGGPATGRGAHLLLIDDPIKNRDDADSEVMRKKLRDWYTSTAYTRLMPGGRVVVIQTRWHEDDLAGWLQAEHAHEGWEVLSLKALSDDGHALWPEQYDAETLGRIRRTLPPRDWEALYQNEPSPETGNYFKAEWLRSYETAPSLDVMRIYGASDYAVKKGGGDYTVHIVIGVDPDDRMYVLDLWRRQTSSDRWVDAWCDLVLQWHPMEWGEEQGQILGGVGPFLEREARRRQAYTYRRQFPSKADKAIRAQSIRGRMANQGLYLPKNAPWRADFEAELMGFPAAKHDDQVDALSLFGVMLDHIQAGQKPENETKRPPRRMWERFEQDDDDDEPASWKVA